MHIRDAVDKSFVYIPIMGIHKIFLVHLFVNGSFRCDSRDGQFMGDSIFLYDLTALVDAGFVG